MAVGTQVLHHHFSFLASLSYHTTVDLFHSSLDIQLDSDIRGLKYNIIDLAPFFKVIKHRTIRFKGLSINYLLFFTQQTKFLSHVF